MRQLCLAWLLGLGLSLAACTEQPKNARECSDYPAIFPDYVGVTIPYNIAPLNFRLDFPAEACFVKIGELTASGRQEIRFDEADWHALLEANKGKSLEVELYTKEAGAWTRWKRFPIEVSERPIDSHLVYRLIEPGYEKWHIVGIYQRDLTSFDEAPIIRNDMTGYNCMNCHSFCMGDPGQMLFHMRAANGATYLLQNGKLQKLNTKTDGTISNLTYPAWHPSGRYVTTSVNTIRQFFHSVKERKMEVFDLESDVVVYDVQQQAILSAASLITKSDFETFPAFSPDGKWLYFCSAPAMAMPDNYDRIRYNLCRVAFDAEKGAIQLPIDTLVRADSVSCTFPRLSPDGRFLLYTETAYGQFPIWHTDAEQRMLRLSDRTQVDMSQMNSADTDSYHSWSSGSDWVVFSSRRDNGLYTLPYFCAIDAEGHPAKPFLLPQEDPEKYDYQLYSYNLPELVKGRVEISPYEIQQVALNDPLKQVAFK
ncbi:PD40 domain-containing protein [Parabacteroides distasonis]|nr:PD40 domain-containing protein [Parabacteroides distasonis]